LRRVQFVWLALLISITAVGGFLLLVDGRPIPRLDGLAMPALAEAGSPNTLESIFRTRRQLDRERWTGIVIHHSFSPSGSAATISRQHEQEGYQGLGHHFIIGNGSGMTDGEVYVGARWLSQLPGAHAAGPLGHQHNLHSVSICLVGDGRRQGFSPAQIRRAAQLAATLCRELEISADAVLLHSDIVQTQDPGPLFPTAAFRAELADAM
jgi:N-acetyl-anhydromuramyl-L-alanine amidase AmpD